MSVAHGMPLRIGLDQHGRLAVRYRIDPIPASGQPAKCWEALGNAVALLSAHLAEDDGIVSGSIADLAGDADPVGVIWALLHVAAALLRGYGPRQAQAILRHLGTEAATASLPAAGDTRIS